MKKLALLVVLSTALALTGCNFKVGGGSTWVTNIETTTTVDGKTVKNSLSMVDPAMRAALGNNPNTAAYVTIENNGNQTEHLISASCDCAATASLHTMTMSGNVMTMAEQKDGFDIAPGQKLVFAPGGNHIMLAGLKSRSKDGDVITLHLVFRNAGNVPMITRVMTAPPVAPN